MKVLIEILIIALLIFAGWKQSYSEHLVHLFPNAGLIQTTHHPASPGSPASSPAGESQWPPQRKQMEELTR